MHFWDSNNNKTIGTTERLKKISAQDLNSKLGVQLIGEIKRSGSSKGKRERKVDENVR